MKMKSLALCVTQRTYPTFERAASVVPWIIGDHIVGLKCITDAAGAEIIKRMRYEIEWLTFVVLILPGESPADKLYGRKPVEKCCWMLVEESSQPTD